MPPVLLNILPNVYWFYNTGNNTGNNASNNASNNAINNFKIELKKNMEYYKITTLIDLDEKANTFWGKSLEYTNDIKIQLEKEEFSKLLLLLKKINEVIKTGYLSNQPVIITTYKPEYIELGLVIWLYFFNTNAGISFDNIIKLMTIKVIGNIILTDTIKKFLAFINLNQIKTI